MENVTLSILVPQEHDEIDLDAVTYSRRYSTVGFRIIELLPTKMSEGSQDVQYQKQDWSSHRARLIPQTLLTSLHSDSFTQLSSSSCYHTVCSSAGRKFLAFQE